MPPPSLSPTANKLPLREQQKAAAAAALHEQQPPNKLMQNIGHCCHAVVCCACALCVHTAGDACRARSTQARVLRLCMRMPVLSFLLPAHAPVVEGHCTRFMAQALEVVLEGSCVHNTQLDKKTV